jgi:hypothetical protein
LLARGCQGSIRAKIIINNPASRRAVRLLPCPVWGDYEHSMAILEHIVSLHQSYLN